MSIQKIQKKKKIPPFRIHGQEPQGGQEPPPHDAATSRRRLLRGHRGPGAAVRVQGGSGAHHGRRGGARGAAAVVRRKPARPAMAARRGTGGGERERARRGAEGVRGVGVGGDAAADAGSRGDRLLLPVDGPLAHRGQPRRRHAGGETREIISPPPLLEKEMQCLMRCVREW